MTNKDLLKFILAELSKRPHVLAELQSESVIVNRADTDGMSLESLFLEENEVLGKRNGKLVGLPYSGDELNLTIGPSSVRQVLVIPVTNFKSSKLVIDLITVSDQPDQVRSTSFEMLLKVVPNGSIEYSRYAILGDSLNYDFELIYANNELTVMISNSETLPINATIKVLK